MNFKASLMDEIAIEKSLARLSHEIIEKNKDLNEVVLVGIKTRGLPIADKIASNINKFGGVLLPVGVLDITNYRDDTKKNANAISSTQINFSMTNKVVILTDDVLFTGRTCRAAIDAIFDIARPAAVFLAVLVDRGHRELPIRADYIGKNIPTSRAEDVCVRLKPIDEENSVTIYSKD